jgi:SpoVK/Ycf46/Vps4 family AAA+-type ATPase
LTTDDTAQVTVLGATNRPFDVDKAILRRMPRAFLFDLPDEKERLSILTVILKGHRVADDLKLSELAARTQGYSGAFLLALTLRSSTHTCCSWSDAVSQEAI